jgi:hypothetical protein
MLDERKCRMRKIMFIMIMVLVSCGNPNKSGTNNINNTNNTNNTNNVDCMGCLDGLCYANYTCNSGLLCDRNSNRCVEDNNNNNDDPVCGNGVLEQGEACDGEVNGYTCESQGFIGGDVVCTDCQVDFSQCVEGPVCGNGVIENEEQYEVTTDGTIVTALGVEIDCSDLGFDTGELVVNGDCSDVDYSGCYNCNENQFECGGECHETLVFLDGNYDCSGYDWNADLGWDCEAACADGEVVYIKGFPESANDTVYADHDNCGEVGNVCGVNEMCICSDPGFGLPVNCECE